MRAHGIIIATVIAISPAPSQQPAPAAFDSAVKPLLAKSCAPCHNAQLAQGGLNVTGYGNAASVAADREGWDKIVRKLKSGEMPPKGIPRSQAAVDGLVQFMEKQFELADRNTKPDPGRVTARRLNRSEYANTIRDLLQVDFRAEREFPVDDSGEGFDNVGDVLSISPVLMEKYMAAAGTIASRAIGADPLPKPVEHGYAVGRDGKRREDFPFNIGSALARRFGPSTLEATHRIEWDGEYLIRAGLPGQRTADSAPVDMGLWMDGKLLKTISVNTTPPKKIFFSPYSEEDIRVFLPAGDHVFRIAFINDEFVKTVPPADLFDSRKNKFAYGIAFSGPFPSALEKPSRKRVLVCDPNSGPACVEKILSTLARRAYRRPVAATEIASLTRLVDLARTEGLNVEQGLQLALRAVLVNPNFLFHIEYDPEPTNPSRVHRLSAFELASRLSYFLWSSMPDDELLTLAESGKLGAPAALDAQVKRMLADPRSAALSDNFAGQWLEIRNLYTVKPDPQKFPEWGPELRDSMATETRMFFESILRENRPLTEFLNARYTFLNQPLAKFYGIEGVSGPEFRRVELATDQRGGILSHASVLTVSSYPTRTSVVIRGKYVLDNILGAPPPAAPADVPPLDEEGVGVSASLRQQMEKHRENATCAVCHSKMDPLGFGLENYDGIGKWRTMDGKFPVDSSGILSNGKTFSTPAEMRAVLTAMLPDFSRCMAEKMLVYSLGRGLTFSDRRTVDDINRKVAASGYKMQSLIYEVVRSLPFQSRRGELIKTTNPVPGKEIAQK